MATSPLVSEMGGNFLLQSMLPARPSARQSNALVDYQLIFFLCNFQVWEDKELPIARSSSCSSLSAYSSSSSFWNSSSVIVSSSDTSLISLISSSTADSVCTSLDVFKSGIQQYTVLFHENTKLSNWLFIDVHLNKIRDWTKLMF